MALSTSTRSPNVEDQNASESQSSTPSQSIVGRQSSVYHPRASSQSLFQNARNVEMKDSQITTIANANVTINNRMTDNDSVTTILWPHIAAGAIFDSAARYSAGKCHPGTRKKIIDRIIHWIQDSDRARHILWIHGSAGAGKSALGHTICELLKESHPDEYGASFFFSVGSSDCGNVLKLFSTLTYQLAIQFPSMRTELNNVLSRDPSLLTKSMEIQLRSLIVEPLIRCRTHLSHRPVLVIDGLDECNNDKGTTQGDIIALISKYVVEYDIPLRFMILSRPEYWIRDAFDSAPLPDITLSISLRDDVDADKDIKAYLTDEFERIRVANKHFMKSVAPPWPPEKILDRFVEEASGQYIYATTVLKFVGNLSKFSNPQNQLDILIYPGPHRALAFSELDRLYATIIAAYPQRETLKRVLAALLLGANSTIITVILGVNSDEFSIVLDALSSLINIKKPKPLSDPEDQLILGSIVESLGDGLDMISFCHRSFRKFLLDEVRSGEFYVDLDSDPVPRDIINGFFDTIHRNLDQSYKTEPHIFLNIDPATYNLVLGEVAFQSFSYCTRSMLLPLIIHLTAKLEHFDISRLTHMSSIFYFIHAMEQSQNALSYEDDDDHTFQIIEGKTFEENLEITMEFQIALQNLHQALELAREGALSALPLCTDFEATPMLVYLTEYWIYYRGLPYQSLPTIPGVNTATDLVTALKQYHYVCPMGYDFITETWNCTNSLVFEGMARTETETCWRNHGAWRDLRLFFADKILKFILIGSADETRNLYSLHDTLRRFFKSSISDIGHKESFQNPSNRSILAMMTDTTAWTDLLCNKESQQFPPHFLRFTILCWINRQLTNPETITVLQECDDSSLQQQMTAVMICIFEETFLKKFTKPCQKGGCFSFPARGQVETRTWSIIIEVWPLPRGFHKKETEESGVWIEAVNEVRGYNDWRIFHDEVFGEMTGNMKASIDPIISPSQWHPHLVAKLLRFLVRFLYGKIHPDFSDHGNTFEGLFPYITQCLPYAYPTPENLDALRAIVYLYPQASSTCTLPVGLWPLVVEFLHKYDRSILSSEELHLFVLWLNSPEHGDIKTYVGQ